MSLPEMKEIGQACGIAGSGISYQEFDPPSRMAPTPPRFIFGTLPGYLAPDLYSEFDLGGVGCYRLHDTKVTFDAILLHKGVALWSLGLNHPEPHVRAILSAQAAGWASLPVRHVQGRAALIHGPGFDIFGHWLIDFLPRLYTLHLFGIEIETLRFILPAGTPGFARTYLRLIGIQETNLIWHDQLRETIQAEELLVPTLFRLRSRFNPLFGAATRFWLGRFAEHAKLPEPGETGDRLFVSRARSGGGRTLRARAEIEARAAASGYRIVCPELLSIPDQISMFRAASRIIGEYGSGLHGTMFSPQGAVICALRGTSHHPGFAQSGLAERFGHRLGYVFGQTPEHANEQEISIAIEDFSRAMAIIELLGD